MKCSNSSCFNQFDQPANILGECASCHAKHAQTINAGQMRFASSMVRWMTEFESRHNKTIFYSDEFKRQDKRAFTVSSDQVEGSLQHVAYPVSQKTRESVSLAKSHLQRAPATGGFVVSSLPSEMVTMLSWNGVAEGFIGASKNFYLMNGRAPSDAIRAFVRGRVTVCECEASAMVVFLNSICDLIGDKAFDCAFPNLSMVGTSAARHKKVYIDKQLTPGEAAVQVGDWIYLVHEKASLEKFQELAAKNAKGGAASGWNLVCIEGAGAGAKYLGFGMSNNQQGMTLDAIKDAMIRECGGDPRARGWELFISFIIRPNFHGLTSMVEKKLALH